MVSVEVSATVDLDHGLACFLDCLVTKTAVKNHCHGHSQ